MQIKMEKHVSAIVDPGAAIGEGTKIWHWSHICSGAKIGTHCTIGQGVYIGNKARIGNRVKIQNNVSIYDDIIIEDEVFCGPSMVFTNVYNPRAAVSRQKEYLSTLIQKGATLGANSTIICGIVIGNYAFIGAGAVVTKNVKPFALMVGVPATQVGWMSAYGNKIDLPLIGEGSWQCPDTGENYILSGDQMKQRL